MLRVSLRRLCHSAPSSSVVGMTASVGTAAASAVAEAAASAAANATMAEGATAAAASQAQPHPTDALAAALANATTLMRNNYNGIKATMRSGNTTAHLPPLTSVLPLAEAVDPAATKYVMLYFSASWCPPCRQFTPQLADFYNAHKDKKQFEVIFCSWDQSNAEFARYLKSHPDWLAVDRSLVDALATTYNIQTIPSLIVLDAATGEVLSRKGRQGVANDPAANGFPWNRTTFAKHVNVNAPRNAMMIGVTATFGASLLLWLFAQDRSSGSAAASSSPPAAYAGGRAADNAASA